MKKSVASSSIGILKETCRALNIFAASHSHLMISDGELFDSISRILLPSSGYSVNVRKEIGLFLVNLCEASAKAVDNAGPTAPPDATDSNPLVTEEDQRVAAGLIDAWNNNEFITLKEHTNRVRRLLSKSKPPIVFASESGLVPFLIEIMKKYSDVDHEIVIDATWALINCDRY